MKNKITNSIFSILISVFILLPYVAQTLHVLEGHKHTVCTAENEHHFHQQKVNCSIYHQIIEHNAIDYPIEFNLKTPLFFNQRYTYSSQNKYAENLQLESSRAPPYFIV